MGESIRKILWIINDFLVYTYGDKKLIQARI